MRGDFQERLLIELHLIQNKTVAILQKFEELLLVLGNLGSLLLHGNKLLQQRHHDDSEVVIVKELDLGVLELISVRQSQPIQLIPEEVLQSSQFVVSVSKLLLMM